LNCSFDVTISQFCDRRRASVSVAVPSAAPKLTCLGRRLSCSHAKVTR
jgi:hypothetical protein